MAHDLTRANEAMETAGGLVEDAFRELGMDTKAVVINVVYEEGGMQWAVGSGGGFDDVAADTKDLLVGSLRASVEEVREHA